MTWHRITSAVALLSTFGALPTALQAQQTCADDPTYAVLDFWVGEWDVMAGDRQVGHNRIEKILDGCAVTELWTNAGGGEGRSLFYRIPAEDAWKQVWVTTNPYRPGGVKEKRLIERLDGGGVLFRGEIAASDGRTVLDQTRLIPLEDGTVRQVIEASTDGGDSWQTTFDAVYVPAGE